MGGSLVLLTVVLHVKYDKVVDFVLVRGRGEETQLLLRTPSHHLYERTAG